MPRKFTEDEVKDLIATATKHVFVEKMDAFAHEAAEGTARLKGVQLEAAFTSEALLASLRLLAQLAYAVNALCAEAGVDPAVRVERGAISDALELLELADDDDPGPLDPPPEGVTFDLDPDDR